MKRLRWFLALAISPLTLAAGCAPATAGPSQPPTAAQTLAPPKMTSKATLLTFDERNLSAAKLGVTKPGVVVESLVAGGAKTTYGAGASGAGLVLPTHAQTKAGQRMILVMRPVSSADPLNPGSRSFDFGADIKLESRSGDNAGDNGDNVLQRGLYGDYSQFKLQVDKRVPSCTVKSGPTRLFVKSKVKLGNGWHRVGCSYRSGKLSLSVAGITGTTVAAAKVTTVAGTVKPLSFGLKTPVSVGGKFGANGKIVISNPDQFNGVLDNIYLDVL